MSTKVIFRRAKVFVLAEVCLPRRPHAVLPRFQVLSEKRKWPRTWKAGEYLHSSCSSFNSLLSASESFVFTEIVELLSQLELSEQKNHFPRF